MASAYDRTVIPDEGLRIKRSEKQADGTYTFTVYEVRVQEVATFSGEPFSGRRIYRTSDDAVFSRAEDAAEHAMRLPWSGKL